MSDKLLNYIVEHGDETLRAATILTKALNELDKEMERRNTKIILPKELAEELIALYRLLKEQKK